MKKNKNILVTGGAGYIGSHVCKLLKEKGYTPICFDNFNNGDRQVVRFGPLYEGDLMDMAAVSYCIQQYQPIVVCHLAALTSVEQSVKNPTLYYQNNVTTTLNLLHAMNEYGVKYLVFSSSSSIYNAREEFFNEESQIAPPHPYGMSKVIIEDVLRNSHLCLNIKSVILRYSNVGGASYQENLGEKTDSFHIIPRMVRSSLMCSPLRVHSNNYLTFDGTCIRDYVHVKDVSKANILAIRYLLDSGTTDYFNISTGKGYSVLDLIKFGNAIFEQKVVYELVEARKGDTPITICNNHKAKIILGWMPQFNIQDIIYDNYHIEKTRKL